MSSVAHSTAEAFNIVRCLDHSGKLDSPQDKKQNAAGFLLGQSLYVLLAFLGRSVAFKKVIDEARTAGATVHFASLMDICHLKNAELEAKHQKYKGRVVLRGDIVKDYSGSYAAFTEQGSSASHMTAAKVMDIQTATACTQVKMEDAHKLRKIPKSECPDLWIRLPRHEWPESWSSMEDPVVSLERNLYGRPLGGLL